MINFRQLRRYKYQTKEVFSINLYKWFGGFPSRISLKGFIAISKWGVMTLTEGYAWDGPSGPTFDTPSLMRASLVHDALYQLMREGLLDFKKRKTADIIYRDLALEDGTPPWRARIHYWSLRVFGKRSSRPWRWRWRRKKKTVLVETPSTEPRP